MVTLVNAVSENQSLSDFRSSADMAAYIRACHAEGVEFIRYGTDDRKIIRPDMAIGCHLIFYSDWVDFWRGNEAALRRKFGSPETVQSVFSAKNRDDFIAQFKADMDYAESMGVKYAVFHVSDVSLEEGFTYIWEHTDKDVIDASAELINILTDGTRYSFKLLLENLWWKGFSMTDPDLTRYMLDKIHYENKGIMLDTGHLMNTNRQLRSQQEACEYVHRILDLHGNLCELIYGVHLHASITGQYVEKSFLNIPVPAGDYANRFSQAYRHILNIDTHQPFTAPGVGALVARISPDYLVYELSAPDKQKKIALCDSQYKALSRHA
ncbi:MAG: TIM barrel protein [Clostridiales bacterium]|nr:TIM barrel protein [Clostridiales bacterium]